MAELSGKKKLTRGEKMILVAPLLVLAALGHSPTFAAPALISPLVQQKHSPSLEERLGKLPPQKQLEFVRKMAKSGWVVFLDTPPYWDSVNDLGLTLKGVYHFGEPLNVPQLNALERNFKKSADESLRERAAALLYRYRRPAGRTYFTNLLQKGDLSAAVILASNQDVASIKGILKVLNTDNEEEQNDPGLVRSLGLWHRPKIKAALLKQFETALDEEQGGTFNYVIALANQNATEAIPLVRRAAQTIIPGEDFESSGRVIIAGALIKLQAPESAHSMLYLQQQLKAKEKGFSHRDVVEALGLAATPAAVSTLKQIIRNYLATPMPLKNPPYRAIIEETSADELAVLAAEELGNLKNQASQKLVAQLLLRLEKDRVFLGSTNNQYSKRAATVLISFETPETRTAVQKVFGQKWLQDGSTLQQLNKIPDYFIPTRK